MITIFQALDKASNVVVLICVITWQNVGIPVLHQGTSLLLLGTSSWVVGTPLRGTVLMKEGTTTLVVLLWVSLMACPYPTIMRLNRTKQVQG